MVSNLMRVCGREDDGVAKLGDGSKRLSGACVLALADQLGSNLHEVFLPVCITDF